MSRTPRLSTYIEKFFYINHHDRLSQRENDLLTDHFEQNRMPGEFQRTLAIKVDPSSPKATNLMNMYKNMVEEQGVRQGWGDGDDELLEIRRTLVDMAEDFRNNAVTFTHIVEPTPPYGKNWRNYLPPRIRAQLDNNQDDPLLREEQAFVANTMAQVFARHGHNPLRPPPPTSDGKLPPSPPTSDGKPPPAPAGGYKKSYGKKKKTKKTRRKTKNMRRKSKSKSKTRKKNTRKKKHYKKRKSKTHKKR